MKNLKLTLLPALLLAAQTLFAQDADFRARFMAEKDAAKKEVLVNELLQKSPEMPAAQQDAMRVQLAASYLKNLDYTNYNKQFDLLKNKTSIAAMLNSVAWNWAAAGEHLADAEKASKQSLDLTTQALNDPALANVKSRVQSSYDSFADTYAYILLKENKPKQAIEYQSGVYERSEGKDAEINEHYASILNAAGNHTKALAIAEKSIKAGKTTGALEDELKTAYTKVKGAKGFPAYRAAIEKALVASLDAPENLAAKEAKKAELAKQIINEPAPTFTLKDLAGKEVSLSSLKGKTVIIDYWATWCGPCKASFPGMQLAVNKYKNDPNVVFLFIDTFENGDNYLPGVKKFIADNKYTFRVLVDEKGENNRQSKVVSTYKVTGIPTKFIIDKNGNIRFKHVGYSGSNEGVYNEITSMIELVNSPLAATTETKTGK